MSELDVPQAARDALNDYDNRWRLDLTDDDDHHVRAIATPVVITELLRIADWYTESSRLGGDTYLAFAGELRRRAKQLEAGGPS